MKLWLSNNFLYRRFHFAAGEAVIKDCHHGYSRRNRLRWRGHLSSLQEEIWRFGIEYEGQHLVLTRFGAYHAEEEYEESEMDHTLSSFLELLQAPD